jgi:hypothetical protein
VKKFILPALLLLLGATPAFAANDEAQDLFSVGVGIYDVNDDETAADFRLEYRWAD